MRPRISVRGVSRHGRALDARELAQEAGPAGAGLSGHAQALAEVEQQLATFPPLVFAGEARNLKKALGRVAAGEAFLLQGGDCAESFAEHGADNIRDFFRVFLQMAVVLTFAAASPVVKVGRIAGQFAKPRSSPTEKKDGKELPSYRGDIINGIEFTPRRRAGPIRAGRSRPIASRPRRSTCCALSRRAAMPISAACTSGCWASSRTARSRGATMELADRISEALGFMQACGLDLESHPELRTTDFYTSHEALLLGFEQAMTREDSTQPATGTAPPATWSGSATAPASPTTPMSSTAAASRTRSASRCGPSPKPDELLRLIDMLNPENEPGRLTLICRFGADKVGDLLPPLIRAVKREGRAVVWSCDPMHGNTITSASGYKTRPFDRILKEVKTFFAVHAAEGTYAGGVHLEMTGQNVTECTGGARAITDEDLNDRYHTFCDPRLNAEQSIELAFLLAELLKQERAAKAQAAAGGGGAVKTQRRAALRSPEAP